MSTNGHHPETANGSEAAARQPHVPSARERAVDLANKVGEKLIRWLDRSCEILDVPGLMAVAGWDGLPERRRPLI